MLSTKKSPRLINALQNVATNACLANFTLPGNFPFGTPGATKYFARDAVVALIDGERPRCQEYIDRYINLLDCVNPILDVANFQREVDEYWNDPNSVSLCWMSQFLMVMGLGAFATPEEPSIATELMMGAEACLMQTPFMFRPSLASLRAVSLMVIAKQTCNPTCWWIDSCWSLLGLLVRICFIFGLPQDVSEGLDPAERASRRKLWLTILYLDVKLSMPTGMPPLTRRDELGNVRPDLLGEHSGLQQILAESLPTVLTILSSCNSTGDHQISYEDVLQYNAQLRSLIAHANTVCTNHLQRLTVETYLRRCLMILHRPFALHIDGPTLFHESYWSSLECTLAVLMHYRELWYADINERHDLVGRAFTLDFFPAALQVVVHLLRSDAPLAWTTGPMDCEIPPRQIIIDTMKSCVDIWKGEQDKSVCWRTGYEVLDSVMSLVPEVDEEETGGGSEMIHPGLQGPNYDTY